MCLYVKEGEDVRIADKPITVYKVVKKYFFGLLAVPPYFNSFTYKRFIRHKLGFGLQIENWGDLDNRCVVGEGFHAFTTEETAKDLCAFLRRHTSEKPYSVVVMTIPAGAKFVLGNAGDIVSNQLVWK